MRNVFGLSALFFFLSTTVLFADVTQDIRDRLFQFSKELNKTYRVKYEKDADFKKNIAILDLDNIGEKAKQKEIGQAVSEMMRSIFADSAIFKVIERKNLAKVLDEYKLQLAGITSSSNEMKMGGLLNADALIVGGVSEMGDNFNVSIRLVDVATGETLATKEFQLKKDDMISVSEKLQMAYVEEMGIGIGLSGMGFQLAGNNPGIDKYFASSAEEGTFLKRYVLFDVRYRFFKFLMATAGLNYVWISAANNVPVRYSTNGGASYQDGSVSAEGLGLNGEFNVFFVFLFNKYLNLSLGGGVTVQGYNYKLTVKNSSAGVVGVEQNSISPSIDFQIIAGLEWFISPRLAVNIRAGYYFGSFRGYIEPAGVKIENPPMFDISGFRFEPIGVSFYF
jgi:TolB-like protein